ncbi:hypothetical protein L6452_37439 [Arctium lappa]|uniref:Uncharacterized protein n=1 Tax=Arctium lappa TaxID=4217 RepID=A0ACB8Y3P3_ARCLA|nr:hypothetical protein L6452_37439 [Arctium lappa]
MWPFLLSTILRSDDCCRPTILTVRRLSPSVGSLRPPALSVVDSRRPSLFFYIMFEQRTEIDGATIFVVSGQSLIGLKYLIHNFPRSRFHRVNALSNYMEQNKQFKGRVAGVKVKSNDTIGAGDAFVGLDYICGCSVGEANLCLYALICFRDAQPYQSSIDTDNYPPDSSLPLAEVLNVVLDWKFCAMVSPGDVLSNGPSTGCCCVKLIDFSPGEKYLVTYNSHEPSTPHDSHRVLLNIFDVRTGKVMRDFKGNADEFSFGGTRGFTGVSWPVFRNWSGPSVAAMCDASIYSRGWSDTVCVAEPHSDFATAVPGDSTDLGPGI